MAADNYYCQLRFIASRNFLKIQSNVDRRRTWAEAIHQFAAGSTKYRLHSFLQKNSDIELHECIAAV